jgi:glyoxylase-like metal-dependent hydrolase (beta-lactamase superfamily II)
MGARIDDVRLYMFSGGENRPRDPGPGVDATPRPIIWFALTHPRGTVVIDGGNAPEVAVDPIGHWGKISEWSITTMAPEQAAVPSLRSVGIDPADVRWIVQSHLHLDHTGAVAQIGSFPNAQVLVTRAEYEWAHRPDAFNEITYVQADFVKPGVPWVLLEDFEDGWDVFGDGVLRCWRTPGHSAGHQSFEVHLPSGQAFLLAVDAANNVGELEEGALTGVMVSAADFTRSAQRLRRLAWRAEAQIVTGHDPHQWRELRHAPDHYA